jgi:hypothetical protein
VMGWRRRGRLGSADTDAKPHEGVTRLVAQHSQGQREGHLYDELSKRYLKLTGNMRRREQETLKAERDQVCLLCVFCLGPYCRRLQRLPAPFSL